MTLSDKRTPSMFVIAGVNGAGKSTLYEVHPELFSNTERLNADEVLRQSGGDWRNPNDNFKAIKDSGLIDTVYIYDNSTAFQLVAVESKR